MSIISALIGTVQGGESTPPPSPSAYAGYGASPGEGYGTDITVFVSNWTGSRIWWSVVGKSDPAANPSTDMTGQLSGFWDPGATTSSSTVVTTVGFVADATTEGTEYWGVNLGTTEGGSDIWNGDVWAIADLSTGPSYDLGSYSSSVNEGGSFGMVIATTNVPDSTTLYWTVDYNSSSESNDFDSTSGSFVVSSNAGSFSVPVTSDLTTEGSQTFKVQIRTGSTSGTVVGTTTAITINDTSTTPPPSYTWSIVNQSAGEGFSNQFDVGTSYVPDGTTLYWTIPNIIGIDSSDFTANTGSFSITANAGSFSVEAASDGFTEGTQTYFVQVRTDSTSGNVVLTSGGINISDNSNGTVSYTSFNTATGIVGTSTDNSNLNLNENYTVEWWQKVSHSQLSSGNFYCPISQYAAGVTTGYNFIDYAFNYGGNYMVMNGWYASFNFTPSNGTWDHIAISATNGHAKAFINGTKVFDRSDLYMPLVNSTDLYLGKRGSSSSFAFPGKITGVKISNVAVYSSDFTPSFPPTADANTVLQFVPTQASTLGPTSNNSSQGFGYNCDIVRDAPV